MAKLLFSVCGVAAVAVAMSGCVERMITIDSNPAGAMVWLNDEEVGRTPTTVPFTWYGVYDVRLAKDGYATLQTTHEAKAPWWETPGIDLVAEALPGTHRVDLHWQFELKPYVEPNEADVLERARQLRDSLGGTP